MAKYCLGLKQCYQQKEKREDHQQILLHCSFFWLFFSQLVFYFNNARYCVIFIEKKPCLEKSSTRTTLTCVDKGDFKIIFTGIRKAVPNCNSADSNT